MLFETVATDYELLCELGLAASERMDKDRFYIGGLAQLLP